MGKSTGRKRRGPDNLYERGGIFYARITVDGVEHRESLKTRDRAEAERRLEGWLKSRSPYKGTIRHTFQEAATLWLEAWEGKEKTLKGYAKLLSVLERRFGDMFWDQVDKAALQTFIRDLKAGEITGKKSGTATANRYLTVISNIADHVRELPGWPEVNPVRLLSVKARKERRHPYIRPPASHIEEYLARMKGTFGDLCRFALATGARMDEIASLKRHDVHGGQARLWRTKSGFRVISLNAEALALVEKQPENKSGYLFETRNRDRYKRVTEMWREYISRAQESAQRQGRKLVPMRFHDLRHEYAIRDLERGGNIYRLKDHLGHSTVRQTEEYLRYLTPDQAAIARGQTAQNTAQSAAVSIDKEGELV